MEREYKRIRKLLEKFYQAMTSPSEEEELCDFFRKHNDLPDDMMADKATFTAIESAIGNIEIPENLDRLIMDRICPQSVGPQESHNRSRKHPLSLRKFIPLIAAAAVVTVILLLVPLVSEFRESSNIDVPAASFVTASLPQVPKEKEAAIPSIAFDKTEKTLHPSENGNKSNATRTIKRETIRALEESELSEEDMKAMEHGFSLLAKAGRKIAYAKERIDYTDRSVSTSLEMISRIVGEEKSEYVETGN